MGRDEVSKSEEVYAYKDMPMIPSVFAELLKELCLLQRLPNPFRRSDAIRAVESLHLSRGGAPARQGGSQLFKKASVDLRSEGFLESPAYGYWSFRTGQKTRDVADDIFLVETTILANGSEPEQPEVRGSQTRLLTVLEERGSGSGSLYVYYSPTEQELSNLKGEKRWPCKVGYSANDYRQRILEQISTTSTHTMPTIGLVIHTDYAREMETAIHAVLKAAGVKITGGGAEWFSTSPEEVGDIATQFEKLVEALLE